jgi:hypothetical protein
VRDRELLAHGVQVEEYEPVPPRAKPKRRRPRGNPAEAAFFEELTADGWEVFKRGWPDFICVRNGKVLLVEVKPTPVEGLRHDQVFILQLLADAGLNVAVWNPKTGYRRVMPAQKDAPTT